MLFAPYWGISAVVEAEAKYFAYRSKVPKQIFFFKKNAINKELGEGSKQYQCQKCLFFFNGNRKLVDTAIAEVNVLMIHGSFCNCIFSLHVD